ncbi:MAG TPA: non-heme iron oxygenase ferredoxin subunit [Mycobacteriales bacterium]|jgi:3-phenylpropionate/trans-cinnamate dioxygenase ferredoxin subunit|nr:non-heme iron oxygenase ferredoxin subunit [Mycobacteriales bacterium]
MSAAAYESADFRLACKLSQLADNTAVGLEIDGVPLCVARTQGEVYAISDICSHADVNLSDGDVEDGTVECWLHGSRFDLRTGRPTGLPANRPVPTYPVKIDGDDVYVSLKES